MNTPCAMHRALREPEQHLGRALARGHVGACLELGPGPCRRPIPSSGRARSSSSGHHRRGCGRTDGPGSDARTRSGSRPRCGNRARRSFAARSSSTSAFTSRPFSASDGEQSVEHLGVVEVGPDRTVDARVLDLHRDLPSVRAAPRGAPGRSTPQRPASDPSRGRTARDRRPARCARPPRRATGAMGGTSACRVASAACASGGKPSAMKPII